MTKAIKILALGVALAATATMARADELSGYLNFGPSGSGDSQYTLTMSGDVLSVTFNSGTRTDGGGNPVLDAYGTVNKANTSLGNFSFNVNTGVLISDSSPEFSVIDNNNNTYKNSTLSFTDDNTSTPTVTYSYDQSTGYIDITLAGTLSDNYGPGMFSDTPGTLFFSSQNVFFNPTTDKSGTVSYSGTITANPAPEPSSLALLGTGLLGAAGIARRRFIGR